MKKLTLLFLALGVLGWATTEIKAADTQSRMLAHDVYFTLKDKSDAAKTRLAEACKKYLSNHPGTVWFDAAVRVQENRREVNDQDFDVALHILFKDKASHDRYQNAPKHHRFIEENKDSWQKVRVFDSWIVATAHPDTAAEKSH